jgi:hypothetical protein
MKLDVPDPSARGQDLVADFVTDAAGNKVGFIQAGYGVSQYERHRRRREIVLYGKYRGEFDEHKECAAFAEGVAAVLNHLQDHMVSVPRDLVGSVSIECPSCAEPIPVERLHRD